MNTYAKVQSLITAWKSQSLSRTDLIRAIAEACLGWPYVWGAAGQKCTPACTWETEKSSTAAGK